MKVKSFYRLNSGIVLLIEVYSVCLVNRYVIITISQVSSHRKNTATARVESGGPGPRV